MNTTFFKGREGFCGKTKIDLGITGYEETKKIDMSRVLTIKTTKGLRGGIQSYAGVALEDGDSMIWTLGADFQMHIEKDPNVRCTEKTVKDMHNRVLGRVAEIVAKAKAHYAKEGAKAAA